MVYCQVPRCVVDTSIAFDPLNPQPVIITSPLAEVVVFARPTNSELGTATRRFDDVDNNGFPDSFRLHYRTLLIRPDLNLAAGAINGLVPTAADTQPLWARSLSSAIYRCTVNTIQAVRIHWLPTVWKIWLIPRIDLLTSNMHCRHCCLEQFATSGTRSDSTLWYPGQLHYNLCNRTLPRYRPVGADSFPGPSGWPFSKSCICLKWATVGRRHCRYEYPCVRRQGL